MTIADRAAESQQLQRANSCRGPAVGWVASFIGMYRAVIGPTY